MNGDDKKSEGNGKPETKRSGNKSSPDGKDRPQQSPQRKRWIIIAFAILLLAGIIVGLLWWLHIRHRISTDDAFIDTHAVHIAAQVPGRVEIRFLHKTIKMCGPATC